MTVALQIFVWINLVSFSISAATLGSATYLSYRARDVDATIVGVLMTAVLAVVALCWASLL